MFDNLKKALVAENNHRTAESRSFIENGYCSTWAEHHRSDPDRGIREYSTARRWEQYQAGEIDREKAAALAIQRMEKANAKNLAEKLEKLEHIAAAPDLIDVSVSVEWKHNRTWGYNPATTATIHTAHGWEQFTGTASGYGYDKRSAAVGAALNQSESVLKILYLRKENALNNPPEKGRYCGANCWEENTSNNSLIHYGAGYGVLPYFEGGVGISSHVGIFKACGYTLELERGTDRSDFYFFVKAPEEKC